MPTLVRLSSGALIDYYKNRLAQPRTHNKRGYDARLPTDTFRAQAGLRPDQFRRDLHLR